jgi:hypothetical protein
MSLFQRGLFIEKISHKPNNISKFKIIFCDFGEDPDDEPCFAYLWKTCRSPMLLVVCPNNKSSEERLWEFMRNYQNLLSTQPLSQYTVYVMTLEEFKGTLQPGTVVDKVLICAPVGDLSPFLVAKQFYLQGSLEEKSFNTKNSETFLTFYKNKGLLREVPTSLCSQAKPTVELLQSMRTIPQIQEGTIVGSAKMAIGRIDPSNVKSNQYAETVINPKISGRGINFRNVLTLYSIVVDNSFQVESETIQKGDVESLLSITNRLPTPSKIHIDLANQYVTLLKSYSVEVEMELETIDFLSKINMMLEGIFPGIWKNRTRLIYSSDDIDDSLQKNIQDFGSIVLSRDSGIIPGTMPFYDLVAATEFSSGSLLDTFGDWEHVYNHWIQVFSS